MDLNKTDKTPLTHENATRQPSVRKTAWILEDPFASALAGIVVPATALGLVISVIYGLSLVI